MPNGWSKARDLAKLAEMRAQFEFEIPLGDLPGIPEEFSLADGPVQVWLQFGREQGFMVAQVALRAQLELVCQRCMGPMPLPIARPFAGAGGGDEREARKPRRWNGKPIWPRKGA